MEVDKSYKKVVSLYHQWKYNFLYIFTVVKDITFIKLVIPHVSLVKM